jgi:predicted metal-dependent HD superfamily phosphohydrolase
VVNQAWVFFLEAWQDAGLDIKEVTIRFNELKERYLSDTLHYHDLEHVLFGVEQLVAIPALLSGIEELRPMLTLAYFFRSAVYDPGAPREQNARASAKLAREILTAAGGGVFFVNGVASLIMDQIHDVPPPTQAGRVMADLYLSELSVPWEEFEQGIYDIRREWRRAMPDNAAFWAMLVRQWEELLERPRIFCTDARHSLFETAARANIGRAIAEPIPF